MYIYIYKYISGSETICIVYKFKTIDYLSFPRILTGDHCYRRVFIIAVVEKLLNLVIQTFSSGGSRK